MSFLQFVQERSGYLLQLTYEHVQITVISVLIACVIGIPLGILLLGRKHLSDIVMAIINACQAVPSLAFLGLLIPVTGIGMKTTIILVIIFSILPITKNTYIAISNISPDIIETAQGLGFRKFQILTKVQIPIALPVIMAGVRIAAVWAVGTVTVAAYAGGGGLGNIIYSGISLLNVNMILSGAILACLLAMIVDWLIGLLEKEITPEGLKRTGKNEQ